MSAPYSDTLWDHFSSPRNAGPLESADAIGHASVADRAPRFTIYLQIRGHQVARATFQTFGCGYSIAACSALTEMITEKTISECWGTTAGQLVAVLEGIPEEKRFCADLAVAALRDALAQLEKRELLPHDRRNLTCSSPVTAFGRRA